MNKVKISMIGDKRVQRDLKKLDERVRKRVLKKSARKGLKPAVAIYKRNIKNADEVFAVYRDGKVYAEIKQGQLKRSIGIKFPKRQNTRNTIVASVGPRKTGRYADPEKGGWYAAFISFGFLRFKDGSRYKGANYGWAQKAINISERVVSGKISRVFTQNVQAEIKKLGFTKKIGLR